MRFYVSEINKKSSYTLGFYNDNTFAGSFQEAETNKNNDLSRGLLGTTNAHDIKEYNSRVSSFVADQQYVSINRDICPSAHREYRGHELRVVFNEKSGDLTTSYPTPGNFN